MVHHFFNLIKFILLLPTKSAPSRDFGVAKIIEFSSFRIVKSGLLSRTSAQVGEPMGFSPFFFFGTTVYPHASFLPFSYSTGTRLLT